MKGMGMKKIVVATAVLTLCIAMLLCTAACDLFGGSGDSNVDNRGNLKKPSIVQAGVKYETEKEKSAVSDIGMNIEFTSVNKGLFIKQKAKISRKSNGEKFYASGECSVEEIGNQLEEMLRQVLKEDSENEIMLLLGDYVLRGVKPSIEMGASTANNTYNIKANVGSAGNSKDVYVAVKDESISEGIDFVPQKFVLSDYLMTDFFNLKSISKWTDKDDADNYFDVDKNTFKYELKMKNSDITDALREKIKEAVPVFVDFSSTEMSSYKSYFETTVSNWFEVKNTETNAFVDINGLPKKIENKIIVDVNIPLTKLNSVLDKLYGAEKIKEIKTLIEKLVHSYQVTGTEGANDTIGLRLNLSVTESYSYGNCSFQKVSDDMFASADSAVNGRRVITAAEIDGFMQRLTERLVLNKQSDEADEQAQTLVAFSKRF